MYNKQPRLKFVLTSVIPGVFSDKYRGTEIKPVEPDQGNACAGKDESSHLSFPVFVNPAYGK